MLAQPVCRVLHGSPDPRRRQRHLDVVDADRLQRVEHRADDRRRRADRAGLATALGAERVVGAGLAFVEL